MPELHPPHSSIHQHNGPGQTTPAKSAAVHGIIALLLCIGAFVTAPPLLLIPYAGFLPALLAGTGLIVAGVGLHNSNHVSGIAVTGLIVSIIVFALLAGTAGLWNVLVADPAIRDYDELHDTLRHARTLIFGS